MPERSVFAGLEDFREVRENNLYYVDKTSIIKELVEADGSKVFLFTRPRRFGKTLTLSMLREFFDIELKDSSALFEGLAVSKDKELCNKWMNQHPVLSLSLKEVKGETFALCCASCAELFAKACMEHSYLLTSPKVDELLKRRLHDLYACTANEAGMRLALRTLCSALHQHWGKRAVVLVDEHDAPLVCVQHGEDYDKLDAFLSELLETAFDASGSLEFALMAGCLSSANRSVYTGLDHAACCGVDQDRFADQFGFTPDEVQVLLAEQGLSHKAEEIRAWYSGYCFGQDQQIYCPWDIVKYAADLETNPEAKPQAYWSKTSGNDIIRKCLCQKEWPIERALSTLMQGGCIEVALADAIAYDSLDSTASTLWTLLYRTGYLTKLPDSRQEHDSDWIRLRIPNKAIRTIFAREMDQWLNEAIARLDLTPFFAAFWAGDEKAVTDILSDVMLDTVSVFGAYKEDYLHSFVHAVFCLNKYEPLSSREKGRGFADVIVNDEKNKKSRRSAVIEAKRADSPYALEQGSIEALSQIEQREYDRRLFEGSQTVLHWGIAFCSRYCLAKCRTIQM